MDVHRIHILLGSQGGVAVLKVLNKLVTPDILSDQHVKEFTSETYVKQDNDSSTQRVKRILNFYINYDYREKVIDKLMDHFNLNEFETSQSFYMTTQELYE